jgi:hypothetical protein
VSTELLRDDLIATRALLARGWTTHTFHRNPRIPHVTPDRYCILGAIAHVTGASTLNLAATTNPRARSLVLAVARMLVARSETKAVDRWNDTPGRRKREVLLLFDALIENQPREEENA